MTAGRRRPKRRVPVAPLRLEYNHHPLSAKAWLTVITIGLVALLAFQLVPGSIPIDRLPSTVEIRREEGNQLLRQDDRAVAINKIVAGKMRDADIILFGSSSPRESFLPGPDLRNEFAAACAKTPTVVELTTPGQGMFEALFLLHRSGPEPGQLAVVVVSPAILHIAETTGADGSIFDGGYVEDSSAFAQAFADQLPTLAPHTEALPTQQRRFEFTRSFLHRQTHVWLKNYVMQNLYGFEWPAYTKFRFAGHKPVSRPSLDRARQQSVRWLEQLQAANDPGYARSLAALRVLINYARDNGVAVVLVESAVIHGEAAETVGQPTLDTYLDDINGLANEAGVAYIDFNDQARLTLTDFADLRHVLESGRKKWSGAFVNALCSADLVPGG